MSADDCDRVNSARPMRTWFYSARNQRGGIATTTTGDREEMNPTAPPPLRGGGGRHEHTARAATEATVDRRPLQRWIPRAGGGSGETMDDARAV